MIALYLYVIGVVYLYWIEAEDEPEHQWMHILEVILWPVMCPLYMGILWYKNRKG